MHDASDELAVANGCRFDQERADHVCAFFETELVLYEGEKAGQPFRLMDWQVEFLSRLFGWVRYSDQYGREVRRFRKGSLWVPKKNGKSPLAAGVGLYLLSRDGEQGQKVFSAAKDGVQAGIMHMHARQMVQRSPWLSSECAINKTTGQITHEKTASFYKILSGDNVTGQEGLNGSVIIDETHVVDSRLAGVLEYMGASRSEPIQLEVSTAGNNPEGYGKHQYNYGKAVAEGTFKDDQFLFVEYGAPQDATDEQCGNPDLWREANPSWGVTINVEDFESSHERAQRSVSDFAKFKMYRLNIWTAAENPWLSQSKWLAGRSEIGKESLLGYSAYGGLDLSRTRDMSSFSLTVPDDDMYRLLTWFWMPEARAEELKDKASFEQWAADGWLELTPGDVIDYRYIESRIRELLIQFNVIKLRYDQRFAEELTQTLEEECGLEREAMQQSANHYAGPMDDFEGLLKEGRLKHDGNPVLTWQAGHVATKDALNGGRRPVKPGNKKDDPRTIDGIVASIMSLSAALSDDGGMSVYDKQDRGFIVL